VKLQRKALIERLASQHADLYQAVRGDVEVTGDFTRGLVIAPKDADKDRFGAFTDETFRLFAIFHRLEVLAWVVRTAHTTLLTTTILGLVGLVASFLAPEWRPLVLPSGLSLAAVQTLVVVITYACARRLDSYEDIT
jgi:hypothetical protein